MEIEEGDVVVTPEGKVGKVFAINNSNDNRAVITTGKSTLGQSFVRYISDLIKVNEPLRVAVDCERDARYLIETAEEYGIDITTLGNWVTAQAEKANEGIVFTFSPDKLSGWNYLTDYEWRDICQWTSDSDRIESWLEYNSDRNESDYNEPKPEDYFYKGIDLSSGDGQTVKVVHMTESQYKKIKSKIDDLESKLEYSEEKRDELLSEKVGHENMRNKYKRERDKLQERVEELEDGLQNIANDKWDTSKHRDYQELAEAIL